MNNIIYQEIQLKSNPSFSEDGFATYIVKIDAIGVLNNIFIDVAANSEKEAAEEAINALERLDGGDISIKEIIHIKGE
jgi:Asp-tRNA(Asn)/Glu-tRNA(Gln) amidotransferase A subunit family amidase